MKRNLLISLFSGIIISSIFFSCDETEPYYHETFTRFATVRESGSSVWLDFDCINQSIVLSNFNNHDHLNTFKVHNGSRVLATISLDLTAGSASNPYTVKNMDTLSSKPIDPIEFQDTLGLFFYFSPIDLGFLYPSVWAVDQYINVSFSYFPNPENPELTNFYFCPKDVKGDTLRMRLISENTDTAIAETAESKMWAYNMLSLKTIVPENDNVKNNLDVILSALSELPNDSIYVEVATADSLHIYDRNLKGWRGVKGSKRVIKIKNVFN